MVFFQFCNNLLVHKLSLYSRQGRYYFAFRCVGYLKKNSSSKYPDAVFSD